MKNIYNDIKDLGFRLTFLAKKMGISKSYFHVKFYKRDTKKEDIIHLIDVLKKQIQSIETFVALASQYAESLPEKELPEKLEDVTSEISLPEEKEEINPLYDEFGQPYVDDDEEEEEHDMDFDDIDIFEEDE